MIKWVQRIIWSIIKYIVSRCVIFLFLFGIFGIGIGLSVDFFSFLRTPIQLQEHASIEVTQGMSIDRLANILELQKNIDNALYFKWYGRLSGQARQLKVGEYTLQAGMRPQDVLNLITSGRSTQYSFTIIEGWTFQQLREMLKKSPHVKDTLDEDLSAEEVMVQLGLEGVPYEGYFLPETFLFPKHYSDKALLKRSYEAMQGILDKAWETRDLSLPIQTKHELLTLASIIEKETGVASERAEISGVFIRRLEKNMRLQTDPTVIYGLGKRYTGQIFRSQLNEDSPYNTYTRNGLPPTPIAMPSIASIYAAANPKAGASLYFVAKGDGSGEHVFSNTLDEHNKAVRSYRKRTSK